MNPTAPQGDRIPVTLLTGFLGSGKTTILNTLLRDPDCAGTLVIINEFGEIGLDHELVVQTEEVVVVLQSGCMCCSLRGDLLDTLIDLRDRRAAGELDFSRVVIETTGLADPTPILHTLLTSVDLTESFVTDGVVVTVDAANLESLYDQEEARRQIALADLVLLTKTDLPEADAPAATRAIRTLNAAVPIRRLRNGQVDPRYILGLGHFSMTMKSKEAQAWLRDEAVPRPNLGDRDALRHIDRIRSIAWTVEKPLSASIFDIWMDLFMARHGGDILRFKALVHIQGSPVPFVVHGVRHIFHPPVPLPDWHGEDRRTKLVLIVRDFTDFELKDLFMALTPPDVVEHILPAGLFRNEVLA